MSRSVEYVLVMVVVVVGGCDGPRSVVHQTWREVKDGRKEDSLLMINEY